ncbi:MAG: hypothetical protein AB9836_00860 [Aminipila sp.]
MEIKRFNRLMCFVAFGAAVLATVMYFLGKIPAIYYGIYLPMEAVAGGLRWLSLKSTIGNIVAWLLYLDICLIPAFFAFRKKLSRLLEKIRNKQYLKIEFEQTCPLELTEIILIVLSVYLFFMMYCFINPGMISNIAPQIIGADMSDTLPMLKYFLAVVAYSLIVGYLILKFTGSFKNTDIWKQTERILLLGTMAYVAFSCFVLPLNLFQQYEYRLSAEAAIFVMVIKLFLDLLPIVCFVGIMESGVRLIQLLKENKYDQSAVSIANLMAERSRTTVIVSVLCNIIQNVIQLIFWREMLHANFLLDIPFIPLILAFAGLLIAEYLKESSLLYDDNQMII